MSFHLSKKLVDYLFASSDRGLQTVAPPTTPPAPPEKRSVLLVGQTGVGKSSLCAFLKGQSEALKLGTFAEQMKVFARTNVACSADAVSTTKEVSSFTESVLFGENDITYEITFIDTPGFLDTQDAGGRCDQDATNMQQIENFINKLTDDGLHCIALVVNSSEPRLTSSFKTLMDRIKTLLRSDVSEHIFVILTKKCAAVKVASILKNLRDELQLTVDPPYILINNIVTSFADTIATVAPEDREQEIADAESAYNATQKALFLKFYPHVCSIKSIDMTHIKAYVALRTDLLNTVSETVLELANLARAIEDAPSDKIAIKKKRFTACRNTMCIQCGLYVTCHEKCQLDEIKPLSVFSECAVDLTNNAKVESYKQYVATSDRIQYELKSRVENPKSPAFFVQCAAFQGNNNCSVCGCVREYHMHVNFKYETLSYTRAEVLAMWATSGSIGHVLDSNMLSEIDKLITLCNENIDPRIAKLNDLMDDSAKLLRTTLDRNIIYSAIMPLVSILKDECQVGKKFEQLLRKIIETIKSDLRLGTVTMAERAFLSDLAIKIAASLVAIENKPDH